MSRRFLFLVLTLVACSLFAAGCGGSDGDDGTPGVNGTDGTSVSVGDVVGSDEFSDAVDEAVTGAISADELARLNGESCSVCHNGNAEYNGASHQAVYDDFITPNEDKDGNTYAVTLFGAGVTNAAGVVTLPFTVTKNGTALASTAELDAEFPVFPIPGNTSTRSRSFYAMGFEDGTAYTGSATVSYVVDHFEAVFNTVATAGGDLTGAANIIAAVVLRKGVVSPADSPINSRFQPYDVTVGAGGSVGAAAGSYSSLANVAGCEKCHGAPYMKHANYIVDVVDDNDFLLCRSCHKAGQASHATQGFQLLHDDPEAYAAGDTPDPAKYDTDRELMLDVHMSHAMEFAYPQSMRNCVTCHEGNIPAILDDAFFTFKTCRSCHAVDKLKEKFPVDSATGTTVSWHTFDDLSAVACEDCHKAGGIAGGARFTDIHTGYDPQVYTSAGVAINEQVVVNIDTATLSGNTLTVGFSATSGIAAIDPADIVPERIYVAGYGYSTKDFITSQSLRNGSTNEAFSAVTQTGASWSFTFDISSLDSAGYITDGVIKKLEIAVLPVYEDADELALSVNATSKTFDLASGTLAAAKTASEIVDVNKCNDCHAQLGLSFHGPYRGGSVVVCRVCHVPTSGGGHMEMQSRSIDSYVHAIHTFQPFDTDDVDMTDALEKLRYDHHIEATFPNFTITNCESCHFADTYNVPDQSKSLPGKFSAAFTWSTDRNIGAVPSYNAGPASRACGACHRAELINEDEAGELAALNAHTAAFGYLVEDGTGVLDSIIKTIMAKF